MLQTRVEFSEEVEVREVEPEREEEHADDVRQTVMYEASLIQILDHG